MIVNWFAAPRSEAIDRYARAVIPALAASVRVRLWGDSPLPADLDGVVLALRFPLERLPFDVVNQAAMALFHVGQSRADPVLELGRRHPGILVLHGPEVEAEDLRSALAVLVHDRAMLDRVQPFNSVVRLADAADAAGCAQAMLELVRRAQRLRPAAAYRSVRDRASRLALDLGATVPVAALEPACDEDSGEDLEPAGPARAVLDAERLTGPARLARAAATGCVDRAAAELVLRLGALVGQLEPKKQELAGP